MSPLRSNRPSAARHSPAFSLVEIVLAMGLLAFVVTALLGAFAVGMNTDRESIEELEATHILQSVIAERRANPVLISEELILPPLDTAAARNSANPIALDEVGRRLAQPGKFGLVYRITPEADKTSAAVYCTIYWPGHASADRSQGRVEMVTRMELPR